MSVILERMIILQKLLLIKTLRLMNQFLILLILILKMLKRNLKLLIHKNSEKYQKQSPEFQGLREFRNSIDSSGANSRSRMSPFHKAHRQRKFNLSFDGTVKPTNNEYGFLEDLNNQQNIFADYNFNQNEALKNEDHERSFEIHIETEDDPVHQDEKAVKESKENLEPPLIKDIDLLFKSTNSKNDKELSTNESDFCKNYDFELWRQENPELKTNLKTSDDLTKFIIFLDHIKRKLDKEKHQENEGCEDANPLEGHSLKDQLMDNLIEIEELRELIKDKPSQFISEFSDS